MPKFIQFGGQTRPTDVAIVALIMPITGWVDIRGDWPRSSSRLNHDPANYMQP